MKTLTQLAHSYKKAEKKPLLLNLETGFYLAQVSCLKKTDDANSDMVMVNSLTKLQKYTNTELIITSSFLAERLNLPFAPEPEDIFDFDESGKAIGLNEKFDPKRFRIKTKVYDASKLKEERFVKYEKTLEHFMDLFNSGATFVKTKLSEMYNDEVRRELELGQDDDLADIFFKKNSSHKIHQLKRGGFRKDLCEKEAAFVFMELQSEIESPIRYTSAYNSSDDRGWFNQMINEFHEYYFGDRDFQDAKYPATKDYPLKDENNPNKKRYNEVDALKGYDAIKKVYDSKVSFLTANGYRKAMSTIAEEINQINKTTVFFFNHANEMKDGKIDHDKLDKFIDKLIERSYEALKASFPRFYRKYKDISIEDVTPGRKDEMGKDGSHGPFTQFGIKNIEDFTRVLGEHAKGMMAYYEGRADRIRKNLEDMVKLISSSAPGIEEISEILGDTSIRDEQEKEIKSWYKSAKGEKKYIGEFASNLKGLQIGLLDMDKKPNEIKDLTQSLLEEVKLHSDKERYDKEVRKYFKSDFDTKKREIAEYLKKKIGEETENILSIIDSEKGKEDNEAEFPKKPKKIVYSDTLKKVVNLSNKIKGEIYHKYNLHFDSPYYPNDGINFQQAQKLLPIRETLEELESYTKTQLLKSQGVRMRDSARGLQVINDFRDNIKQIVGDNAWNYGCHDIKQAFESLYSVFDDFHQKNGKMIKDYKKRIYNVKENNDNAGKVEKLKRNDNNVKDILDKLAEDFPQELSNLSEEKMSILIGYATHASELEKDLKKSIGL